MNIEKLKQFVVLTNELMAEGVIGFSIHTKRIHVSHEDIKGFENLEIIVRDDLNSNYPYEIFHKNDEFTVFCLVSKENVKHFPQFKDFVKEELLKQLAALEEEVLVNEQSTSAV
jgi:hypothetical protein